MTFDHRHGMTIEKWAALVTLGCFMTLASYAYGTTARAPHAVQPAITAEVDMEPLAASGDGYAHAERSAAVKLWKRVERTAASRASALARKQAEAYAAVYGITPANMNSYREWW